MSFVEGLGKLLTVSYKYQFLGENGDGPYMARLSEFVTYIKEPDVTMEELTNLNSRINVELNPKIFNGDIIGILDMSKATIPIVVEAEIGIKFYTLKGTEVAWGKFEKEIMDYVVNNKNPRIIILVKFNSRSQMEKYLDIKKIDIESVARDILPTLEVWLDGSERNDPILTLEHTEFSIEYDDDNVTTTETRFAQWAMRIPKNVPSGIPIRIS